LRIELTSEVVVTTSVSWLQGAFASSGSHSSAVIHCPFTADAKSPACVKCVCPPVVELT
jgi:hypothetical protein